ncbi:translation factor SUA5 [Alcanivorax sp. DSM 26293]|jgi:L-threonylcarbamoyladenylate synthase|nr:translation factor SUA5 [Alcanivorax sp. DSM 26293]
MQGIFPSFSQGELVMYQHLHSAAQIIQAGGVVAYPTESVYGLGCDPFNESAVMHLLAIKERPVSKGLILIGADLSQLAPYLRLTDSEHEQLAGQWPAPRTYLVEAGENVPAWVRGAFSKVAVRVPDHPLARDLCRAVGHPIISTSANISGRPAARNQFQVARQLGERLDFIVSGVCDRAAKPSTIIDLESGRILRA